MASSSGAKLRLDAADRVAEAQRLGLHHRLDLDQRGRAAHLLQHRRLAAGFQRALQDEVLDEVGDDAVLAFGGDDDQPLGTRLGRLGGHQFDARRVDDRQQFLGHRLGGGQEPGPQAGGRNDRRARNRYQRPCHRSHLNAIGFIAIASAGSAVSSLTPWRDPTQDRAAGGDPARPAARWHRNRHDAEADALCGHLPDVVIGGADGLRLRADRFRAGVGRTARRAVTPRRARAAAGRPRATRTARPLPLQWGEYRPGGLVAGPVRAARARRSRGCPPRRWPTRPSWCSCPRWRSTGRCPAGPRRRLLRPLAAAGGSGGAAGGGGPRRRARRPAARRAARRADDARTDTGTAASSTLG